MSKRISFSDNDHWRFGWGDGLYNFYEQHNPMWVTFGPCRRQPTSYDLEVTNAAKLIANKTEKLIYVAMSGGIDSELVAQVMLQEKIPFKPVIVQFVDDYNKEDISYAFEFCRQHHLEPEIINLDMLSLFKKESNEIYAVANFSHVMQMHILRHIKKLDGFTVIGGGEYRFKATETGIVVPVHSARMAVCHCMQLEQIEAASNFYCYTPEMMLGMLREAIAIGFDNMSQFSHNLKETIYHKYWPNLKPRPKFSGFEKISEQRIAAQKKLTKALKKKYGSNAPYICYFTVEELEKQLSKGLV